MLPSDRGLQFDVNYTLDIHIILNIFNNLNEHFIEKSFEGQVE